jgi:cyclophilin family peptidyl-prolyl cis-trans isomerase
MWILLLPLLAQVPAERAVLDAEHARASGLPALLSAAKSASPRVQQLAARALGRLENPAGRDALTALLASRDAEVRIEAAHALGQIRVSSAFEENLRTERDARVRAALFEAIGRGQPVLASGERVLVAGLIEADARARAGAVRGLESLFRLNARTLKPSPETLAALRTAIAANGAEQFRELAMLTLNAAGDRDPATNALIMRDPSPQVRRLARFDATGWERDPSPVVRYQALRTAGTCATAATLVTDPSQHVALQAIDMLGTRSCDAKLSAAVLSNGRNWRERAHALVSLAKVAPDEARAALPRYVIDTIWQARTYGAAAARIVKDSTSLAAFARDSNPNVAIAAMTTVDDAVRALRSSHAGLLLAAAEFLKPRGDTNREHLPRIVNAWRRLGADGSMTLRDPRVALLDVLGAIRDSTSNPLLTDALSDADPAVAAAAAAVLSRRTGSTVTPVTVSLPVPPRPSPYYIEALLGARARITMKGLGVITVELLTDDAPVTVAIFAQLAESGQYNGLTFHRIVPNFVLQGGSPGADEYDGRTREFMRDEVGRARHLRGAIGISTRGRDTGDGQIYFDLVDNFRLDHDYTVLAQLTDGWAVMDAIQEGDVIEKIEIVRKGTTSRAARRR